MGQNSSLSGSPDRKELNRWLQRALDVGASGLCKEFEELSDWTPQGVTTQAFDANEGKQPQKNRYPEMPCGDSHRVILEYPGVSNDYIHANYVRTPRAEKRYICTQGPLDSTMSDFWLMVLQEDVEVIVMLCDFVDNEGSVKCDKYLPIEKFGSIVSVSPNIIITNIAIYTDPIPMVPFIKLSVLKVAFQHEGKEQIRTVRHFHWKDWPEGRVPNCHRSPIKLLSCIRDTEKPIVIHCSGGTGRTAIIMAIDHILTSVEMGKKCLDLNDLLMELREQRLRSILFDMQYLYIHRVLFYYFLEKNRQKNGSFLTKENRKKLMDFIKDYEKRSVRKYTPSRLDQIENGDLRIYYYLMESLNQMEGDPSRTVKFRRHRSCGGMSCC